MDRSYLPCPFERQRPLARRDSQAYTGFMNAVFSFRRTALIGRITDPAPRD